MTVPTPVHENSDKRCVCSGVFDINLGIGTISHLTSGSGTTSRVVACFDSMWYIFRPYIAPNLLEGDPVNDNSRSHLLRQRVDPLEARLLQGVGRWLDLGIPGTPSDASNLSYFVDAPGEIDIDDLPDRPRFTRAVVSRGHGVVEGPVWDHKQSRKEPLEDIQRLPGFTGIWEVSVMCVWGLAVEYLHEVGVKSLGLPLISREKTPRRIHF